MTWTEKFLNLLVKDNINRYRIYKPIVSYTKYQTIQIFFLSFGTSH